MDDSLNSQEVGKIIRDLRKAYGDTQEECADKVGIKRPLLAHIEIGKRPPKDETLQQLAFFYAEGKTDRDYLLRELRKAALRQKSPSMSQAFEQGMKDKTKHDFGQILPHDIITVVREKLITEGIPDITIAKQLQMPLTDFREVIEGKRTINNEQLRTLATVLKEDPDSWALFTGYMTPNLKIYLQKRIDVRKKNTLEEILQKEKERQQKEVELTSIIYPNVNVLPDHLIKYIKFHIKSANINIEQFAQSIGISFGTLASFLTQEECPTRHQIKNIASVLNINTDFVFLLCGLIPESILPDINRATEATLEKHLKKISPILKSIAKKVI